MTDLLLAGLRQRLDGAAAPDAVPTGFPSLDRMLGGGPRPGDLVLLAGDAGSGKSALALAMALRAAQEERLVLLASGEASPARVLERALAIEGRVSVDRLRRGAPDDATRLALEGPLRELEARGPTLVALPDDIATLADAVRQTLDVELVVVDALPALAPGARARDEELATTVRRLKRLALEQQVVLLATLPLAVEVRGRPDPRPRLEDLGCLGAAKAEADHVLAVFREEMYDAGARGIEGATELHVLKNRNGPTGWVDLFFFKDCMRFEDMVEPDR